MRVELREGCELSKTYANRPHNYKVVETGNVLGYVVSGGGRGAAYVSTLYRADIHVKVGKVWHVTSSFEYGERLNAYTFVEDSEGCTFATIAWNAVNALENRAGMRQLLAEAQKQKIGKKKPKNRRECKACGGSGDADYLRQDNASGPGTPGPACKHCKGKGYITIKKRKK